jgi:hypothetical protein
MVGVYKHHVSWFRLAYFGAWILILIGIGLVIGSGVLGLVSWLCS